MTMKSVPFFGKSSRRREKKKKKKKKFRRNLWLLLGENVILPTICPSLSFVLLRIHTLVTLLPQC